MIQPARKIAVVINGYPRAGKDTVSRLVSESLAGKGWRGHSISGIDPVRETLRGMGVPIDLKTEAERRLMADVKSALERYDWWATRLCARQVREWLYESPTNSLCFAHMREAEASEQFRLLMEPDVEVRVLRVMSPREEKVTSNHADADVENMFYDLTIANNGTLDDLREKCADLADMLTEERL